ncbi:MAG: toxin-antitoxin system YwqK family antitoxin, partial [Flavobacteriales bacterium]
MKRILVLLTVMFFILADNHAQNNLHSELCEFNPNWQNYEDAVGDLSAKKFKTDQDYISTHLKEVISVLEKSNVDHLNSSLLASRKEMIDHLKEYRKRGLFPQNYFREDRIPVFIDPNGTHCAVAYLIKTSGFPELAKDIAKANNYAWVKEINNPELLSWQANTGLSVDDLKLIQGAYDYYPPFAFELPNKYEVPQKPEVIVREFDKNRIGKDGVRGKGFIWCSGEGTEDGVLNGKWEQWHSPEMPWIVGYFSNGQRSGQWEEYYPGTTQLCRTEHWRGNKLNGVRIRFDREGKVIEEIWFNNGEAEKKINYDRTENLQWIRVPLNNNIVQTQVYTMQGLLIGEGQEEVYNPSGLMWFQNIELTALNSAAVTAKQQQDVSRMTASNEPFIFPGGRRHPMALSFEPALVEYRKLGDWKFYPVYNYSFDEGTESLELSSELLSERFPSMDLKTIDSVVRY